MNTAPLNECCQRMIEHTNTLENAVASCRWHETGVVLKELFKDFYHALLQLEGMDPQMVEEVRIYMQDEFDTREKDRMEIDKKLEVAKSGGSVSASPFVSRRNNPASTANLYQNKTKESNNATRTSSDNTGGDDKAKHGGAHQSPAGDTNSSEEVPASGAGHSDATPPA